jgi:hypothetical protein
MLHLLLIYCLSPFVSFLYNKLVKYRKRDSFSRFNFIIYILPSAIEACNMMDGTLLINAIGKYVFTKKYITIHLIFSISLRLSQF